MPLELAEDRIRGIVAQLAKLRGAYGEVFAAPALIEPTGQFFPDQFQLDPPSIDRLLRRMLGYTPIAEDVDVKLGFIEPEGQSPAGGGCGSGGCSSPPTRSGGAPASGAVETEDGYAVLLHVQDVGDPTVLTATIARALGRLVLFEADEEVDPRDAGAQAEITAIASGLGLLLLNGACVYNKGCGGMRRHQATFLDVEEIALGLALFVRSTGAKPAAVRRHLEVTQREAFDAALDWVDGQPTLVRTLSDCPETLADGVFALEAPKGLLSRLFSRKSRDEDALDPSSASVPKRLRSEQEERRLAEARALVDEALSDT